MFRPSMPISGRNAPSALRRIHVLQRTAGKLFYQWAEVSLSDDKVKVPDTNSGHILIVYEYLNFFNILIIKYTY